MSKDIIIQLTSEQQKKLSRFLAHDVRELKITPQIANVLFYGIVPKTKVANNRLILTKEQRQLLKEKFNCKCQYIDVTRSMELK